MKPILKYRGGKAKDIANFERYIPQNFNRYFEPFFGGGATFFHLEPKCAVIGDVNKPLMAFYRAVRDSFPTLENELAKLQWQYEKNQEEYLKAKANQTNIRVPNKNEELYYSLRNQFNQLEHREYSDAALYYFINKTSYSGMIRYNARGHYNVPFGRYAHLNAKLVTQRHSKLLQNAELHNDDYSVLFDMAESEDFMFLDPPYDCIFNDYGNLESGNGFGEDEHRRLAGHFHELRCKAMMIIGKTQLTEKLYAGNIRSEYGKEYAVNIRNRFHSSATHIIVTNY